MCHAGLRILLFLRGIAGDASRPMHFRSPGPLTPSGREMAVMALVPDPFPLATARTRARPELLARAAQDRVSIKTRTQAFSSHNCRRALQHAGQRAGAASSHEERFEMPQHFCGPLLGQVVTALDGSPADPSGAITPPNLKRLI